MSTLVQNKWINTLRVLGAWWAHDGNPIRPHAILSSGLHSNLYVNCRVLFSNSTLVEEATSDILAELLQRVNFGRIDGVAGIVTSGKIFAESIAERLRKPSLAIVVERENGIVSFSSDFYCEKRILLVDDVLSTAHTIQFAISAMQRNRCEILNPLSFFLNRSGLSFVSGYPVCSLISKPSDMWRESECPLCQNGSLALPLEGKKNWDRLVRE